MSVQVCCKCVFVQWCMHALCTYLFMCECCTSDLYCTSPVDFEVFEVMAPKVVFGGWFLRHEPASYPHGPTHMTNCEGEKSKRRDVPGKVDRWIKAHLPHVNNMLLRTSQVDCSGWNNSCTMTFSALLTMADSLAGTEMLFSQSMHLR